MTHAASLIGHIDRQQRELHSLIAKLDATPSPRSTDPTWNAREILLHLLGATRRSADDLRQALGESRASTQRQAGGEYVDIPALATAGEVASELSRALDEVRESIQALDDDALAREVTIAIADAGPTRVPIGLVLGSGLTTHFDEHVAQLREALRARD